jgi:hypothetical protein
MKKSLGIGLLAAALLAIPVSPIFAQAPGGAPPIFGTVDSVNATANTITVSTPQGDTGTVKISSTTVINTEKTITVADLKVGDKVQVSGAPTGITAASIVDGDVAAAMPSFGFRRPGGGGGAPGGGGPGRGGPGGPGGDNANASGTITSTSPLTIALEGGASLTITMAPAATVSVVAPEAISDIKAGDRVIASGALNDDGSMNAAKIAVNFSFGGFGGRGGGPRPGGG